MNWSSMQQTSFTSSWNLDQILDDLNEFGFALIDDVYSAKCG
jgi:SM-20-related protein